MISVENVSKRFGDFAALDDVSIEAPDGKLTALLGPSGSGKSTLLRVIAGLEVPDSGTIVVSGSDATRLPPQKRGIGFVFQHYAAFKHMTLRDNVAFGLKIRKTRKEKLDARVDELLTIVGLAGFATRFPQFTPRASTTFLQQSYNPSSKHSRANSPALSWRAPSVQRSSSLSARYVSPVRSWKPL